MAVSMLCVYLVKGVVYLGWCNSFWTKVTLSSDAEVDGGLMETQLLEDKSTVKFPTATHKWSKQGRPFFVCGLKC